MRRGRRAAQHCYAKVHVVSITEYLAAGGTSSAAGVRVSNQYVHAVLILQRSVELSYISLGFVVNRGLRLRPGPPRVTHTP
jgi:hypothetical protein